MTRRQRRTVASGLFAADLIAFAAVIWSLCARLWWPAVLGLAVILGVVLAERRLPRPER